MSINNFKFAIISDLHIALSHTISDNPYRFHQVEVSIPVLELILEELSALKIDFLLSPGDLTQHGEIDNHKWLSDRLSKLPFPVYVVPGNHDIPLISSNNNTIGFNDFPYYYGKFGYDNPEQLYYTCEVLPGVRLIGLNSNNFNEEDSQIGRLDEKQLRWLKEVLSEVNDQLVMIMIHHNILEHLPGQATHPLGKRYMLENAPELREILQKAGVKLIFTGHLHAQDITYQDDIYEITTGSLVSYPHPYRILELKTDKRGKKWLDVASYKIKSIAECPNLAEKSREWIGDRNLPFTMKLLTEYPLNLSLSEAQKFAPSLRYFWADICHGDAIFNFNDFPPPVKHYFENFSAINRQNGCLELIDNFTTFLV